MNDELITTKNVSVSYGNDRVLHNINFGVRESEIVTILGPNGSGKSTFVRLLIGALKPDSGTLKKRVGLRIGYVPQRLGLDPNLPMTVERFLSLNTQYSVDVKQQWIDRIGVKHLHNSQISALSGGQLQRVLLAQALLTNPHILILDEATQGLDQQGEAAFYRLLDEVRQQQGCAVVLVSHDLHVVMSASDRVVCLNGHVCCEGTPTIVSAAPEYRALFGLGTEGALALYRHEHDHDHHHHHHD
jgi:zinc transport system ATP-binding protein